MMAAREKLMIRPKYGLLLLFLLLLACTRKPPATPIYDEKADAHRDIAAAIATAEGGKQNIVLVFGANW
jgi:hypothetical protein